MHSNQSWSEVATTSPLAAPGKPNTGTALLNAYGVGGPVGIDFLLLKALKTIRAGLIVIVCDVGYGKSYAIKFWMLMLLMFKRGDGRPFRLAFDDLKEYEKPSDVQDVIDVNEQSDKDHPPGGEYGPLAKLMGQKILLMAVAKMNIMDAKLGMRLSRTVAMMVDLAKLLRGGSDEALPRYWETGIETTIRTLRRFPEWAQSFGMFLLLLNHDPRVKFTEVDPDIEPDLHRVISQVQDKYLTKEELDELQLWPAIYNSRQRLDEAGYLDALAAMADTFKQLLGGEYDDMFNGNESLYELLSQRVVVCDYSSSSDAAIAAMEIVKDHIRMAAYERRDWNLIVNVSVMDEAHRFFKIPAFAASKARAYKTTRGLGIFHILASQREADIEATGSAIAINSLQDMAILFVGHLKHREAVRMAKAYGLSDELALEFTRLGVGEFIMLIHGEEPMHIKIPQTELTDLIGETDAAGLANIATAALEGALA